jgi:hypothetical protein
MCKDVTGNLSNGESPTDWSQVRRAGSGDDKALAALLERYWPALKRFLVGAWKIPADRADD